MSKWTDDSIVFELKSIIDKIGCFPKIQQLREMNRGDLCNAIHKSGKRVDYFQNILGFQKRNFLGRWTEDGIVAELKSLIDKIGYFPTIQQLQSMRL